MRGVLSWLGLSIVTGCVRVAEVPATELPRLSEHGPGKPPVEVRTQSGRAVAISGKFREARVVVGGDGYERTVRLRPPFRASLQDGLLRYDWHTVEAADVSRVEIVQRDGGRTLVVLLIGSAGALAGAVLGSWLDSRSPSDPGGGTCNCQWTMLGTAGLGGLGFAIPAPLTKYY